MTKAGGRVHGGKRKVSSSTRRKISAGQYTSPKARQRKILKLERINKLQRKRLNLAIKRNKKQIRKLERYSKKYKKNKRPTKHKRIKKNIKQTQDQNKEIGLYRYCVAYYNASYDKTFRAEVYTNVKQNEQQIITQLTNFLHQRVSLLNKGLQKMFNNSSFVGLEAEQVGGNDIGASQLNKMYFRLN